MTDKSDIAVTARRVETACFALLIGVLNLPLLLGQWNSGFAFMPSEVAAGEWWRVLTHPFVHVSWYHLLLDGAAFFVLYCGLRERHRWNRVLYVFACGTCSLAVSFWAAPELRDLGFCGLSGIAHGLMAISALEMFREQDATIRRVGIISLVIVILKSVIEAMSGSVVFSGFHFGLMGTPIAVSHAGGVIGGLLVSLARHHFPDFQIRPRHHCRDFLRGVS